MGAGARWAAGVLAAWMAMSASAASAAEPIRFEAGGAALTGVLFRPVTDRASPAVMALHGCGGLYVRDGQKQSSRYADWAQRLVSAGFVVMFPDSFSGRGYREICTRKDHGITPRVRADDARAALIWLAAQPGVDTSRLYVIGWCIGQHRLYLGRGVMLLTGCVPRLRDTEPCWQYRKPRGK